MRVSASRAAYTLAAALGLPALGRARNAAPILCFHNVVPDAIAERVGDGSLHLGVSHFADLLGLVTRHYDVLPLDELIRRWQSGASLRGCCALTFDDAYAGVLKHALPVLTRESAPATLFVVTEAASEPYAFWWDVLGALGRLGEERRDALEKHRGLTDLVLASVTDAPAVDADLLPAPWARLLAATSSGLFSLGAHTRRHVNLLAAGDDEVAWELKGSLSELAERVPNAYHAVAYPYGHADVRVSRQAAEAGFLAGFALGQRLLLPGGDPYLIPRLNIPASISTAAFDCWLGGIG